MKKIIVAILSALVGVFGYTLTDSVVEDRLSNLESEVMELRQELEKDTDVAESLKIGDYIKISSVSLNKFLLRENEDGNLEFIHPYFVYSVDEDDVFVHLTNITCQITGFETITTDIENGINYEPDTVVLKLPVITVSCDGYTSSDLSGKQLMFLTGLGQQIKHVPSFTLKDSNHTSCTVSSDGSFSFNAEYSLAENITSYETLIDTYYFVFGKDYAEKNFFEEFKFTYFDYYGLSVYDLKIS